MIIYNPTKKPKITLTRAKLTSLILSASKVTISSLLSSLLLMQATLVVPVFANPVLDVPSVRIQANAHILIDTLTDQTLTEHNSDARIPPASLTKIMTLYIAAQQLATGKLQLDDIVKVSTRAWRTGGSRMFIEPGKRVSVGELIEGIAAVSGNDASIALADHIAGSESQFVELMNQQAQQLGMENSNFVNVSGLPTAEHYTSAHDIAILSSSLIKKYPDFYKKYFSIRTFSYNNIDQVNRNKLLWSVNLKVDGIKTGHTEDAGYSLAVSAKEDNMRLIAVILGAPNERVRTREGEKLLRWGFRYFRHHQLYDPLVKLTTSKVWMGTEETVDLGVAEAVDLVISKAKTHQVSVRVQIPEYLQAPLVTGKQVGYLLVYTDKVEHSKYPLIALEDIEEGNIFSRMIDWLHIHIRRLFS